MLQHLFDSLCFFAFEQETDEVSYSLYVLVSTEFSIISFNNLGIGINGK